MSTTATKDSSSKAMPKPNVKPAAVPAGSDIPEPIVALAQLALEQIKLVEGGTVEVPKDLYENTLPDGLTMATVKKLQDHNANFASGLGLALGQLGTAAMKKDKNLGQVSLDFTAGRDRGSLVFQREKQVADGKGGQQTKYYQLGGKWQVTGVGNRGGMKKVRDYLASQHVASVAAD